MAVFELLKRSDSCFGKKVDRGPPGSSIWGSPVRTDSSFCVHSTAESAMYLRRSARVAQWCDSVGSNLGVIENINSLRWRRFDSAVLFCSRIREQRADTIVPLPHPHLPPLQKIRFCEEHFREETILFWEIIVLKKHAAVCSPAMGVRSVSSCTPWV